MVLVGYKCLSTRGEQYSSKFSRVEYYLRVESHIQQQWACIITTLSQLLLHLCGILRFIGDEKRLYVCNKVHKTSLMNWFNDKSDAL